MILDIVNNFKEGDKIATMRINRPISNDSKKGISADSFTRELDYLVSKGVEEIVFTINSSGGHMFSGLEIYSAIQDAPVKTETRVVGISASIAGIIAQAGDKRTIKGHALFHAHSPRPEAGKKASSEVLNLAFNSLVNVLEKSTSLSKEEVISVLSKETFMSAKEATEKGFFDKVIDDQRRIDTDGLNASQLMNIYNQLEPKPKPKMSKVSELLGLSNESTEAEQIAAITGLKATQSKAEKTEQKNSELENKVSELESLVSTTKREKAELLVNKAIDAKKIKGESKEQWVEAAVENFENVEVMLSDISAVSVANRIDEVIVVDTIENRKDWNFEKWSKEDPEGLENLQKTDSAKFDELLNEYVEK